MKTRTLFIVALIALMLAATSVSAQTGGVSLRPVLKAGEESRYVISGAVDEQVTPNGANGIAGKVHREVSATLLLRAGVPAPASLAGKAPQAAEASPNGAGVSNNDLIYYEAVVEAFETHTLIDGVEKPSPATNLVGRKIEFALDVAGDIARLAIPAEAARTGVVEMVISLYTWAPIMPLEVGQTWGSTGSKASIRDYGYISAAKLSDISRRVKTLYTFTSLKDDRAVIDGAIELRQDGASMLEFPVGPTRVNAIAAGSGKTQIEIDVASSRIVSATSETVLNGNLVNIQPTRAGEKMQPREGVLI